VNRNDVMSSFRSASQEWSRVLKNANFAVVDNMRHIIAWPQYPNDTRMADNVPAAAVSEAALHGHYSFQFTEDDALLRLVYEFDPRGRRLLSAHLGYYSIPRSVTADEIDDAEYAAFSDEYEATDESTSEEKLDAATPVPAIPEEFEGSLAVDLEDAEEASAAGPEVSWLRIDYDPHQERGPLHAPCHMHFSGFVDARLMVHGVPTPRQFIDLVVAVAYPDAFRRHLNETGEIADPGRFANLHQEQIECSRPASLEVMPHVRIPGFT
jgi:hypothetical protein